ncbi:hypothetical protein O7623_25980 [Solwaraspora sp. WMMD791]|uniref:hypothetical protein n=1 Tax=Solwaraspora sp. WMMD791 TaxID=3016086 RepID=UPI00249C8349|nr:hypothetical protein [Solwaraspora sp. WMMD791]WFE26696.1 hypothetical protein O7623_25980 [Solwaraspora sp. WMMD791]
MRHPTDGTLRRLIDEPAGVAADDREHVAGCPGCLARLADAQRDAAAVDAALRVDVTADVDAGWHRLAGSLAAASGAGAAGSVAVTADAGTGTGTGTGESVRRPAVTSVGTRRRLTGWRLAWRSPVVAVVGVAALLAGAGTAAATNWLQVFRAERIAPVTAPEADLVSMPDLSDFGELLVTEPVDVRPVADAAAAEQVTGLSVPQVSELPDGVTGQPDLHVTGRVSALFTFSAERTARTAAAAGATVPPPPPGLDGSQFRLVAGPGFAAVWSQGRPVPALIVARATAPTAYSSGVPFDVARDYLLSLPILPETVAAQLRGFSADGTTLPLFMSVEELTSSGADVDGVPATVFASRDGVLAGVVWVDDGTVNAVAGSLSSAEVLSVARELRWRR